MIEVLTGRRWRCTVCGLIVEAPVPPPRCPKCGVDASYFILEEG